jgi:hypothetical protein
MTAEKIILFQKNNMTKLIELTPEWVLTELPISHCADGTGKMIIETQIETDAKWITLALDTICIDYEYFDEGRGKIFFYHFEFRLEDIKENCPALYKNMKELDDKNKILKDSKISKSL